MKSYIGRQMQAFLQPRTQNGGPWSTSNPEVEEALDQPLYHIQSYGTGGSASPYVFFGSTSSDLAVTNVSGGKLSKGRRFAIFGVSFAFIGGAPAASDATNLTVTSYLEDARKVLESAAYFKIRILEKDYLIESPLTRVPAGIGLSGVGAVARSLASSADGNRQISYATNGLPTLMNSRKLRVALPLPEQTDFFASVTYSAAQTVSTASSIGVWFDGVTLRALQ